MALLSIADACRKAGISKPTMYNNYINSGKISVSQDNAGKRGIDPSELIRVFGTLKGAPTPVPVQQPTGSGPEEMIKLLREQLQKAESIAAEERSRAIAAELRAAKYHDEMISLQNRLLPSPMESAPEPESPPPVVKPKPAAEYVPPTFWERIKDKLGVG